MLVATWLKRHALLPADALDAHPIMLAGFGGWSAARLHMQ
jgi:hypothetical protein